MSGFLWILLIVYLCVAGAMTLMAMWLDTLDNPYSSWKDVNGWIVAILAGACWPILALYYAWSLWKGAR